MFKFGLHIGKRKTIGYKHGEVPLLNCTEKFSSLRAPHGSPLKISPCTVTINLNTT